MKKRSSHLSSKNFSASTTRQGPGCHFFPFFPSSMYIEACLQTAQEIKINKEVAIKISENFNETCEKAQWEGALGSPLATRRDTKSFQNRYLRNRRKDTFPRESFRLARARCHAQGIRCADLGRAPAPPGSWACGSSLWPNTLPPAHLSALQTCCRPSKATVWPWLFQTGQTLRERGFRLPAETSFS